MFLKFKKPFSVYLKWVDGPFKGRGLLFVEGKRGTITMGSTDSSSTRGQGGSGPDC